MVKKELILVPHFHYLYCWEAHHALSLPWAASERWPRAATLFVSLDNCWGANMNSVKGSAGKQKTVFYFEELGSTVYLGPASCYLPQGSSG